MGRLSNLMKKGLIAGLALLPIFCEGKYIPPTYQYGKREMSEQSIESLEKLSITPEDADLYDDRFYARHIFELTSNDVSADIANSYHELLDAHGIILLSKKGVSADVANKYMELKSRFYSPITAEGIVICVKEGIPYETIEKEAKEAWIKRVSGN